MDGRRSILARFWRGDCSLAVSFWVFYVGLTLAVQTAFPLTRVAIEGRTYDPPRIFAAVAASCILLSAMGLFQWVGLWRATRRAVESERASGRHSLAGWSIRVIVVLAIVDYGRIVATDVVPSTREFYEIAWRGDPTVPPYAMRATPDGTQLLVFGGFKYGLTRRFLEQADALPALRTVHLASLGGRLGEALHLADEIRAKGLDTYVSEGCYSACTLAFAAGRQRWLLAGATLGYHAESFLGVAVADHGENGGEADALRHAGLPAAFVAEVVATPPNTIWKPTVDELLGTRAITDVADPGRFAASNLGMYPTAATLKAALETTPGMTVLALDRPARFAAVMKAFRAAYLAGESLASLRRMASQACRTEARSDPWK